MVPPLCGGAPGGWDAKARMEKGGRLARPGWSSSWLDAYPPSSSSCPYYIVASPFGAPKYP